MKLSKHLFSIIAVEPSHGRFFFASGSWWSMIKPIRGGSREGTVEQIGVLLGTILKGKP